MCPSILACCLGFALGVPWVCTGAGPRRKPKANASHTQKFSVAPEQGPGRPKYGQIDPGPYLGAPEGFCVCLGFAQGSLGLPWVCLGFAPGLHPSANPRQTPGKPRTHGQTQGNRKNPRAPQGKARGGPNAFFGGNTQPRLRDSRWTIYPKRCGDTRGVPNPPSPPATFRGTQISRMILRILLSLGRSSAHPRQHCSGGKGGTGISPNASDILSIYRLVPLFWVMRSGRGLRVACQILDPS
jgi:hypothetical protein